MNFIKRMAALEMVILFCIMILVGCGRSYDADTSTVYILKKGKIVSTDVDNFSEENYDKKEFETFVKETIKAYTDENGKNTVKLDNLSIADNTATLTLQYASAEDYSRFSGIDLFTGSLTEALTAGYDFDVGFVDVDSGDECDTSKVLDDSSLNVAIIKGNVNLEVSGDIVYYSQENVKLTGDRTVTISPDIDQSDTETVEEHMDGTEGVITEADSTEDDGSVDDDEMLTGTESTEVVFDFDENYNSVEADVQNNREISDIYTYIIYK